MVAKMDLLKEPLVMLLNPFKCVLFNNILSRTVKNKKVSCIGQYMMKHKSQPEGDLDTYVTMDKL